MLPFKQFKIAASIFADDINTDLSLKKTKYTNIRTNIFYIKIKKMSKLQRNLQ